MFNKVMNCKTCQAALPNLLFDPAAPGNAAARAHIATCAACAQELASFAATMSLLDTWEGPEPSPYFLTRLDARMREERQANPTASKEDMRRTCRDKIKSYNHHPSETTTPPQNPTQQY